MVWKPFRHGDWSVLSCGFKGHETYLPDEPALAARLTQETPAGPTVRCLRCGTWVLGEPRGSGPANEAPLVRRGTAVRDAVILRLLALDRLLKALVLFTVALGIWRFEGTRSAIAARIDSWLPLRQPIIETFGVDLFDSPAMHLVERALALQRSTIELIGVGVLIYGLIQLFEGIGLWLMKRWGEYLSAVATSVFLPLEIYELASEITWMRVAAFVINVAAVAYLVWTKRLFGVRGGHHAQETERQTQSLMEVERAALVIEESPAAH